MVYPPVDLETFRWRNAIPHSGSTARQRPPRHLPGQAFLKGPIPMTWLMRAAQEPGKALHVAVALWFAVGVTKSSEVKLSSSLLTDLGVHRHAGYRGLAALERAELVRVMRHRGRHPVVTLLEVLGR